MAAQNTEHETRTFMKTHFICLANSKKYAERCIAGVEIQIKPNREYDLVKKGLRPHWIRPVTGNEFGQIPAELVSKIGLLDIVEIDIESETPWGYQTENVYFSEKSLRVLGKVELAAENLDGLVDESEPVIFLNTGKAIPAEKIDGLDRSLVMIRPENVTIDWKARTLINPQLRARFTYKNTDYDLPVTDVGFIREFDRNPEVLAKARRFYFVISVGIEFEGFYYKLVAGVVFL